MPEEVEGGFSEVTSEHSLTRFIGIHRWLRGERMYQAKTYMNMHVEQKRNMRSFWMR